MQSNSSKLEVNLSEYNLVAQSAPWTDITSDSVSETDCRGEKK